jgi:hypothetical protein
MAGFLLGELARVAKKRGITEFWASVMAENHGMASLFTRAGGTADGLGEEREFRLRVARILRWRNGYLAHKSIFRDTR